MACAKPKLAEIEWIGVAEGADIREVARLPFADAGFAVQVGALPIVIVVRGEAGRAGIGNALVADAVARVAETDDAVDVRCRAECLWRPCRC